MNAINLAEKLATFTGYWQPRTIGQFNGHGVSLAETRKALSDLVLAWANDCDYWCCQVHP